MCRPGPDFWRLSEAGEEGVIGFHLLCDKIRREGQPARNVGQRRHGQHRSD